AVMRDNGVKANGPPVGPQGVQACRGIAELCLLCVCFIHVYFFSPPAQALLRKPRTTYSFIESTPKVILLRTLQVLPLRQCMNACVAHRPAAIFTPAH